MNLHLISNQVKGFCNHALYGIFQHNTKLYHANVDKFIDLMSKYHDMDHTKFEGMLTDIKNILGKGDEFEKYFINSCEVVLFYLSKVDETNLNPYKKVCDLIPNTEKFRSGVFKSELLDLGLSVAFVCRSIEMGLAISDFSDRPYHKEAFCKHLYLELSSPRVAGVILAKNELNGLENSLLGLVDKTDKHKRKII